MKLYKKNLLLSKLGGHYLCQLFRYDCLNLYKPLGPLKIPEQLWLVTTKDSSKICQLYPCLVTVLAQSLSASASASAWKLWVNIFFFQGVVHCSTLLCSRSTTKLLLTYVTLSFCHCLCFHLNVFLYFQSGKVDIPNQFWQCGRGGGCKNRQLLIFFLL